MSQIDTIKKQHSEIANILEKLKSALSKEDYYAASSNINELAGKLKIHLRYEDDYIYPELLKSENTNVKNISNKFIKEMGDLASVFDDFKNKYNTKSKIESNITEFKLTCNVVIKALEKRLSKEDNELYIYL